jgi:hypothetical protein
MYFEERRDIPDELLVINVNRKPEAVVSGMI